MNRSENRPGRPLLSDKQNLYFRAEDKRINLLTGSVRSGKTWVSLLKWGIFVSKSPEGQSFIMAGKTLMSLQRNCLTLLRKLVGASNFTYNLDKKTGLLFNRRVWLEGANDSRSEPKIRGLTLAGAYCDELTLLPREFYRMLLSRLSVPGAKLFATTNPDTPGHWVMGDIIRNAEVNPSVWEFLLSDNPFLDSEYTESISKEYAGVFYDRYILGKWTAAEGIIYRQFAENPGDFLITGKIGKKIREINIGIDFGGTKSGHAFCASGITYGYGELIALRSERHFGEIGPKELNRKAIDFLNDVKTVYGAVDSVYCDSAEPVLIRGLKSEIAEFDPSVRVLPAMKTRIRNRIRLTLALIAQRRIFVTGDCKTLSEALSTAVWVDSSDGGERLDDGTSDIDSLDAFEYSWERYTNYFI